MKNTSLLFLFIVMIFFGCKKHEVFQEPAKEKFSLLPAAYEAGDSSKQVLYYFRRNDSLFFQKNATDPAIYLELLAGPSVRISWSKGLKDIFCIGGYGGSMLPGGNFIIIYLKNYKQVLFSPDNNLNFDDVRISGHDIFVELFSVKSFIENTDGLGHLIRPGDVKKYYGRYNVVTQELFMD